MTATLPQDVRDVFERFVTCEYTTIDSRQQPIVWPVTPYYSDGGEVIEVTTALGYPKKANDARANPQVSLLFSDPTGAALDDAPLALVQGTAEIDDRDLDANRERYWEESAQKMPATKDMHPPKIMRGMFGWYYTRLYIRVRPERVFTWPGGDPEGEPTVHDSHIEEVRSGHAEEPAKPHAPGAGGKTVWDSRIDELGRRYESAVLSWVAPDGFPLSVRLPVEADASARRIALGAEPAGVPLAEGRACLVAHRHAPNFKWQENFQVRGDLVRDGDGWALVPQKMVGGFELPDESQFAVMRRNFKKARRFRKIAKRELQQREERLG